MTYTRKLNLFLDLFLKNTHLSRVSFQMSFTCVSKLCLLFTVIGSKYVSITSVKNRWEQDCVFFSAYLMTLCYGRLQQANFALLCHWQVRSQDSSCTICTSKPTKHLCISLSSVLHDLCRDCTTETQSSTNIYCL